MHLRRLPVPGADALHEENRRFAVRDLSTGKIVLEHSDERSLFIYLRFTPDSRHLLTVAEQLENPDSKRWTASHSVRIFDVAAGKEIAAFAEGKGEDRFRPAMCAVSPNGKILLARSKGMKYEGPAQILDMEGRKEWMPLRPNRSLGRLFSRPIQD